MHPRNPHSGAYDFAALALIEPQLNDHLRRNPKGDVSLDFSNDKAVRLLNKALLAYFYRVKYWQIPDDYLCPAIPGRADYIHYLADLLASAAQGHIPTGKNIKILDVGTGANCIYPILGSQSYGWKFLASDIDPISVNTAKLIVQSNQPLKKNIDIILQKKPQHILQGIIAADDYFHASLCNPPFHASLSAAEKGSARKWKNLNKKPQQVRNFGGQKSELWCEGGEIAFLKRYVNESVNYSQQVGWFTSLVSKKDNIQQLSALIKKRGAKQLELVMMGQGQKKSHLLAWSFLHKHEQSAWMSQRRG